MVLDHQEFLHVVPEQVTGFHVDWYGPVVSCVDQLRPGLGECVRIP